MQNTNYYSYKLGRLPKGCQLCVQGSKEVIFMTGICPRSCYFCPISDLKYKKDVIYADEWPVSNLKQIIKEAELISAKGAGITGGDPLCRLWRTVFCIRGLKKHFGKLFHIHLYTSLNLVNKKTLNKLYNAGLDEIRFHPDLDDNKLWHKIRLALDYSWDVGIEIPVIPKKEKNIKMLIGFITQTNKISKNKIKFLNLNELEIADSQANILSRLGYKTKNSLSYAVSGSQELALKLIKHIEKNMIDLRVHYCTAILKDRVQLANRIKRRAKNIKQPYDFVTKEGTLIRGAVYLEKPGIGYRKSLEKISRNKILKAKYLKQLTEIRNHLIKTRKIDPKLIAIDKTKLRILLHPKYLSGIEHKNKAIVEEYPTHDMMEISIDFV